MSGLRNALVYAGGIGAGAYFGGRPRRPLSVLPVSRAVDTQQQLIQLRRLVARNTPQTSNYFSTTTYTTTAVATNHGFNIPITSNFCASADFDAQVIGDRFYNVSNLMKMDIPRDIPKVRVIFYWCKKAANSSPILTFYETLDPAAHTTLFDRVYYPLVSGESAPTVRLNLKKIQTIYNKSSDVLEKGDLQMRVIIDNPTAAQRTLNITNRLFIQNK